MIEWVGHILGSDTFRGGALFATALSGMIAIVLLLVKQRPIFHGQKLNARKSLDESVDRELKRLSEEVAAEAERHKVCEEELRHARTRDISQSRKIGRLMRDQDGLRRQLQQLEENRVIILGNVPPATAARFTDPEAPPVPKLPSPKK